MSACTMVVTGLLFLLHFLQYGQASVIVGCPTFRYMLHDACYTCPDNCRECVSDTNCSVCTMGFFGPICENRCGEKCTGTCHKVYGHCTYGCPDGMYPAEGTGCPRCPLHCSVCESPTKCFVCEDGYFGNNCQNRCPDHCTACNKTTGQCLKCKYSYFRLNGKCKSCPQGCALCDSTNTCSQCIDAHFLLDGLCKSCPYGCRSCTTAEKCQSCENGFQGPVHERCLFKCPSNNVTTYNVPYEDGRCGIWQDTSTNICQMQSEAHSCKSSGKCIHEMRCSDSVRCGDESYDQSSCATVMDYECKHKCKQLHSVYGCEAICTIHYRITGVSNTLICLTDTDQIAESTFQSNEVAYCIQEHGTPHDSKETPSKTVFTVVGVVIVALATHVILDILLLVIYLRKRSKKRKVGKKDQPGNELLNMSNIPEENNSTEPETRASILNESETKVAETSDQLTKVLLQPEHKAHNHPVYNSIL